MGVYARTTLGASETVHGITVDRTSSNSSPDAFEVFAHAFPTARWREERNYYLRHWDAHASSAFRSEMSSMIIRRSKKNTSSADGKLSLRWLPWILWKVCELSESGLPSVPIVFARSCNQIWHSSGLHWPATRNQSYPWQSTSEIIPYHVHSMS